MRGFSINETTRSTRESNFISYLRHDRDLRVAAPSFVFSSVHLLYALSLNHSQLALSFFVSRATWKP